MQSEKIELRQKSGFTAALRAFLNGSGSGQTEEIRAITENAGWDGRRSVRILLAGSAISFLILGSIFVQLYREIRRRRASEVNLLHLNRLHSILGQANQAIVRTRDREELLPEIARIAAGHGLFQSAWLGLREGREMVPAAFAGPERERRAC